MAAPPPPSPRQFRLVLIGGLVAGALDILFAMTFWAIKADVPPVRVLQSVASGLLGREHAIAGGAPTAALGLLLHFFIAISMSLTYFAVARKWPFLWRRPWVAGPLYGILLYVIMNFVVIPLSAASTGSRDPLWVGLSVLVHMTLIAMPMALAARATLRPPVVGR